MSIIKTFNGSYCHGEEIGREVSRTLGYRLLDDRYIIGEASRRSKISEHKLMRTLAGKVSAFNSFTHEREINISHLKLATAVLMEQDNFILAGFCSHLIPAELSHVLRVCVIAEMDYRYQQAMKELGVSEKEARKMMHADDESRSLWTDYLLKTTPWDEEIYDILIPASKVSIDDAVKLICDHAGSDMLRPTEVSLQAVRDFRLAARAEVELGKAGHEVSVAARGDKVTLTINKHTIMLSHLEEELKKTASKVEGVKEVETKVGPGFYQAGVYRQFSPELPSKVLLVDDEREFVQTLSERLQLRNVGAAVVYDGEQALSFVEEEEPEVMVLDLKMPGINGIEVLRRIKAEHPDIQVIVLTGHGSDKDEASCMELGAFAYLQKPVDIENLSQVMREAYGKVKSIKVKKE